MGEVVVSSEAEIELEFKETEAPVEKQEEGETEINKKKTADASVASIVRWERFLPKMVVRVLLVEADDSTRQIIAALLRKCSYKVAAVPDGLKAWEVLKGRSHNIDLILTEVDLPSISGYALLTLIMEHEICKNIPVIMMSSYDSVSTVYKCMLRGAADFLVKPVRKNELRNLWQHVWRRQSSNGGGFGPPDESVAQQKVEATAENNATGSPSNGDMACIQMNQECIEKGSDAQSSCTKPEMDAEGESTEHFQAFTRPSLAESPSRDINRQEEEECEKASKRLHLADKDARGSRVATGTDAESEPSGKDINSDDKQDDSNIIGQASESNYTLLSSSREAIDLIGAFDNYFKSNYRTSGSVPGTDKIDSSPLLDLSLRRYPSCSVNQVTDERHKLNHSDASAFSRYVSRGLHPQQSTLPWTPNQWKEHEPDSDRQFSPHDLSSRRYNPAGSGQPGQPEIAFPCPQRRALPVTVPVTGIRFEGLTSAHGSVTSPLFHTQSGLSPMQSPGSSSHQDPSLQVNPFHRLNHLHKSLQQFHSLMDQSNSEAPDQTESKRENKLENLEDRGHFSSTTDQSASSSLCNGSASHLQSIGCGNSGNVSAVPVVKATTECRNEEVSLIHDRNPHRSLQREAALTKFRLKRKDRCYEKKVRYESRKKLAEQRPRVKGQFVRQVNNESQAANSSLG